VITQADLERYMRVQIEESVYYLFTWTQGSFNFEVDVRPERQDFLVSINPESLLLEGARRVDEWSLIEKKIPSFDLIFVVDKDRLAISEANLTDTQQRIQPLLDGSRDVNQVIEDCRAGRVRDRQGAVRSDHRGVRAPRGAHRVRRGRPDHRRREWKSTANLGIAFLQDGDAGRGGARVPPRGRAAPRGGERSLLHRARGAQAGRAGREAMEALRLAAEKGGGRPAVFHKPRPSRTSSWGGSTRRKARTARRAARRA